MGCHTLLERPERERERERERLPYITRETIERERERERGVYVCSKGFVWRPSGTSEMCTKPARASGA